MRFFIVFLLIVSSTTAFGAEALTPKSPIVLQAIGRAVNYLKQNGIKENRLGGRALAALALYKAGTDPVSDPLIQGTLADIRKSIASDGTIAISDHIYTAGICILFLAEVGPEEYRRELIAFGRFLHDNQRKDGSWTYLTSGAADAYPSGDMSMTQYGTMGLWTLHQLGIDVSGYDVNRLGRWLTSVQTAEGAYAYQTTVSLDFKQINWNNPKLSMTAAGLASVYVCRDLFGFNGENRKVDEVHEAFRSRSEDIADSPLGSYRLTIPKEMFNVAQMKGNAWMERNFNPITTAADHFHYYLYALERYAAFKELAENKSLESPPWYSKVATIMLEKQTADGSWLGTNGAQVDTAYTVLFLTRSTRRSFEKWKAPNIFDGGNLRGGRGLPKSTDDIRIEDGNIVSLSEMGSAEQLIERLEDLQNTDEETLGQLAELSIADVENLLKRNKSKIKKMVGHEVAAQRFAAVELLGKSGDVSNAPALIYALTDPDHDVAEAAQKALLRLTRQLKPEPLPKPEDAGFERKMTLLVNRWRDWYRTIDPDAVFEDR